MSTPLTASRVWVCAVLSSVNHFRSLVTTFHSEPNSIFSPPSPLSCFPCSGRRDSYARVRLGFYPLTRSSACQSVGAGYGFTQKLFSAGCLKKRAKKAKGEINGMSITLALGDYKTLPRQFSLQSIFISRLICRPHQQRDLVGCLRTWLVGEINCVRKKKVYPET